MKPFTFLLVLLAAGCDPSAHPSGFGVTEPTGSAIAKADAYNTVARQQAEAGHKSGQRYFFTAIQDVMDLQKMSLDDAASELRVAAGKYQDVSDQLEAEKIVRAKLDGSWGVWVERKVRQAIFLLTVAMVIHFVAGIVALFVPGGWGKAIAIIGAVANPFTWFQNIRDNVYFRWLRPTLKEPEAKKKKK